MKVINKRLSKTLKVLPIFTLAVPYISLMAHAKDNGWQRSVNLLLRPRWEYVDVDNDGKKTANAGTMRAQLGFKLKKSSLSFYIENTWVVTYYDHYYPQKSGYELVADEPRDRITQLWFDYNLPALNFKLGRQVINLDNQRFVGAVNWRQTPQTFDAARVDLKGKEFPFNPKLTLAYICDRQGVVKSLTPQNICANRPLSYSFLGHLSLNLPYNVKMAIYDYHFRNVAETYGANLHGKFSFKPFTLNYWFEYAYENVHNKPKQIWGDANYSHIKLSGSFSTAYGKPFIGIGWERLGKYFVTPFATLHKFNGWADVFLKYTAGSNTYGLNDYYVSVGFLNKKLGKILGVYHKFTSTSDFSNGGNDFGDEFDVLYTREIFKKVNLTLKYAQYNADDDAKYAGVGDKDTTKAWIMLTYKFGAKF